MKWIDFWSFFDRTRGKKVGFWKNVFFDKLYEADREILFIFGIGKNVKKGEKSKSDGT